MKSKSQSIFSKQNLICLYYFRYDLIPHETLFLHADDIPEEDVDINVRRPARILKSTVNGDEAVIHRLDEPYPTECYNHGKLATQT